jgi:hypothetical protein
MGPGASLLLLVPVSRAHQARSAERVNPKVIPLMVTFFLYDFTVCTGITFDDPYTPLDMRGVRGEGAIRFVPLDGFATETLQTLTGYHKKKYDLAIEIASPVNVPASAVDSRRSQASIEAEGQPRNAAVKPRA